ncbi:MAG: hypothetical protein HOJ07_16430 [Rhodospirillaceae bacterium]|nr:hypothetical protein [Rhodospirillaceae bacterium]
MAELEQKIEEAKVALDAHVAEIVKWHFSPETGCPFWLDWAKDAGWDPATEVKSLEDLLAKFPNFEDEWLRDKQPEVWVPAKFKGKPFNIFETGGTTGMPKQRIGWEDYKIDYSEFSDTLDDAAFPRDHYCGFFTSKFWANSSLSAASNSEESWPMPCFSKYARDILPNSNFSLLVSD